MIQTNGPQMQQIGWESNEVQTPSNEMQNHYKTDYMGSFLHSHPEFISVIFDKIELHREITNAKYRVKYGLHEKDMMAIDERIDLASSTNDVEKLRILNRIKDKLEEEAKIGQIRIGQDGAPQHASETMDLTSEHFLSLLLRSILEVHQYNSQAMVDNGHGHYAPSPQNPNYSMSISPIGVSKPQFDSNNKYIGQQFTPGNYYGQPGYPQNPPAGTTQHHAPRTAGRVALGALGALMGI